MYLHGHIFKGMKENPVSTASGMRQIIVCDDNRKSNLATPYDYCSFTKLSGRLSTHTHTQTTALILKGISCILFRSHFESPWTKCTDLGYPKIPFSNVKVASWSSYSFTDQRKSYQSKFKLYWWVHKRGGCNKTRGDFLKAQGTLW